MLYYLCVRKDDVEKLKVIVEGCIRCYVIMLYNKMLLVEVFGNKNWLKWLKRFNLLMV